MFYEKAVLKHFAKFTGKLTPARDWCIVWKQGVYEKAVPRSS